MNQKMPKTVIDVQGWFDFQDYLWRIANALPDGSSLVELGPWMGIATIFLAQSLDALGKRNSQIYAIDTWKGSPNEQDVFDYVLAGRSGKQLFEENIIRNGVRSYVTALESDSVQAAEQFKSVDFVFFDTEHTYEQLSKELVAWIPRMKPGIWFGGHDISVPGIRRAVEAHVRNWHEAGPCWEARND